MNNSISTIEKYAIIKVLSHIMKADGIIHPKEEEYMDKVFAELDISIDDLEIMADMDENQVNSVFDVMSDENKKYARSLFVSMAESDGYVHPSEAELINHFFRKVH